ncbi:LamG-like jellyroll fold domain-containing protein [uncultured Roseobacter sp.]|uniref:LamG-like jellyroll fold domain-containing protein n=1 Tax=uncultured Roseobacter sp. TaxID=114847 RepID=UPI0026249C83|nr:LamG-like jellyroll fold domain-containing protein [uncultured Roseobacter sp.]
MSSGPAKPGASTQARAAAEQKSKTEKESGTLQNNGSTGGADAQVGAAGAAFLGALSVFDESAAATHVPDQVQDGEPAAGNPPQDRSVDTPGQSTSPAQATPPRSATPDNTGSTADPQTAASLDLPGTPPLQSGNAQASRTDRQQDEASRPPQPAPEARQGQRTDDTALSDSTAPTQANTEDAPETASDRTFVIEDGFGDDTITGSEIEPDFDRIDLSGLSGPVTVTYTGDEAGTITDGTATITFSGIEHLDLSDAADVVTGSADSAGIRLTAGGGDDTATGGSGQDALSGEQGNDLLSGGAGNDTISGGTGDDLLAGQSGDDLIEGGGGTDTITFSGNRSDYTITRDGDAITVVDNRPGSPDGTDTVSGTEVFRFADGDVAAGHIDNQAPTDITMTGGTVRETIADGGTIAAAYDPSGDTVAFLSTVDSNAGDNHSYSLVSDPSGKFEVVGNEIRVRAGQEIDFETDSSFDLTVRTFDQAGDVFEEVLTISTEDFQGTYTAGNTGEALTGTSEENSLTGGGGADTILGGVSDDSITGGAGDDSITGGAGDDALSGGEGSDTFVVRDNVGADTITGGESGSDNDAIDASGLSGPVTVTYSGDEAGDLSDGRDTVTFKETETLILSDFADVVDGSADNSGLNISAGAGDDSVIGGDAADAVDGGAGNDTISGDWGDDTIDGGTGSDRLIGGGGNDLIDGGDDNDRLEGQAGNDTLRGGTGNDTLFGGSDSDLLSGGEGDDSLDGSFGNDTMTGGAGNDTLSSWTGAAEMSGGDGSDKFRVFDGFNGTVIDGGEGGADNDIIDISGNSGPVTVSFTGDEAGKITDGNDTLTFTGIEQINLTPGDDVVTGAGLSGAAIAVNAGAGNDTIDGSDGNDRIAGGTGDDLLNGHDGDNTLLGGDGSDTLYAGSGNDSLDGGAGDDFLYVEGTDGSSTIDGGTGRDTLDFGGGAGGSTVVFSADDEGSFATDAGAAGRFSGIDDIDGTAGDDSIDARADDNGGSYLTGAGEDTVRTGDGADSVDAGTGDDLIETGAGNDTVIAGDGADTLSGGAGADLLSGGADADTFILEDGFGNDTITGGESGSDDDIIDASAMSGPVTVTYTGDEAGEITDGTDTLTFSGIERVVLTDHADQLDARADNTGVTVSAGDGNDTIYGSDQEDLINSGAGDDVVYTGQDDDTVDTGEGSDTVFLDATDRGNSNVLTDSGTSGTDRIVLDGAGGTYSIQGTFSAADGFEIIDGSGASGESLETKDARADFDFSDITLIGVDEISGTGAADTITGSAGDDNIDGENGNDLLSGGAGNDTISGASGNDTIRGDTGNDTLRGGDGNDSITGGQGDDFLDGDAGNDTLLGGGGDDLFEAHSGDDVVDGGDGNGDRIYYNGEMSGYDISYDADSDTFTITDLNSGNGDDGSDTVTGVEAFSFGGTTYTAAELASFATNVAPTDISFASGGSVRETVSDGGSIAAAYDPSGSTVATLSAADSPGNTHTFTLISDPSGRFEISGNEIRMRSDQSADFETDTTFDLTIRATDQWGASYDEVLTLTVEDFEGSYTAGNSGEAVNGTSEEDVISGGSGNDTISGGDGADTIHGREGNDRLLGDAGDDVIHAGDGDDLIRGGSGADTLDGGGDADRFVVEDGFGNDSITGGETTGSGNDQDVIDLSAVTGPVTAIYSGDEAGTITDGTDTITFSEVEQLILTEQADILDATSDGAGTAVDGGAGDDTLRAGSGSDSLDGGAGNDSLTGGAGADTLTGGAGDDVIDGGPGASGPAPVIRMDFSDNGSGTAADSSGNGHDGIYQGNAVSGGSGWNGTGSALVLDGSGDYVEIPDSGDFDLAEGSISIRFNADNLDSRGTLFSRDSRYFDDGGHLDAEIGTDGSVRVRLQSDSDSYYVTSGAGVVSPGEWHHVAVTFGPDGLHLYVDGTEVDSDSYTGGLTGNDEPWTLGASQITSGDGTADNLQDYFTGQLDDFVVYGEQIDASGIASLGTGGNGGTDTVVYSGDIAGFTIVYDDATDTFSVTDTNTSDGLDEGTDTITGVENFVFGGTAYSHDEMVGIAGGGNSAPAEPAVASGGEVAENSAGGTVAATLSSTDPDGDPVSYAITDANGNPVADTRFEISGNEIRVRSGADLDFESADSHTVYVVASDGDATSAPQAITITVSDIAEALNIGSGVSFSDAGVAETSVTSGGGNDTISGNAGHDNIDAGDGNNVISTGSGDDTIAAGSGHDTIAAGDGANQVDSGAGNDSITSGDGNDNITAASGDNLIASGEGNDTVVTGAGRDSIDAGSGMNSVSAGDGNDTITSGSGADSIDAGTGDDSVSSGDGNDTVVSGGGRNTVNAGEGANYVATGDGNDSISSGSGSDTIQSGGGNDTVNSGGGSDYVAAGNGDNVVNAGNGANWVTAGTGDDRITTGSGSDTIQSGSGNDSLISGDGNDYISAGDGADTIDSGSGADTIYAGSGSDSIVTGAGNDFISASSGNDTVISGADNDSIYGGTGNDVIQAGDGNDLIQGQWGNDTIDAGGGDDRIQISESADSDSIAGGSGMDTLDFVGWAGTDIAFTGDGSGTYAYTDGGGSNGTFTGIEAIEASRYDDTVDLTGHDSGAVVSGYGGDDEIIGGGGDDLLSGGSGDDAFYIAAMQGNDTIDGGAGASWTDTLHLDGMGGGGANISGNTVDGDGWTLMLDGGHTVTSLNSGVLEMSSDASGVVSFDDGGSVSFTDLERITW